MTLKCADYYCLTDGGHPTGRRDKRHPCEGCAARRRRKDFCFLRCQPNKNRGAESQVRRKSLRCFENFLSHEPLDVAIIGSPSGLHADQGIQCARRGLHVLVEKPIDVNVQKADELIAECKNKGVKLAACFQYRFAKDRSICKGLDGTS